MTVVIDNRTDWSLEQESIDWIEQAVKATLLFEKFEQQCEVSVSIVTNEEIRQINRQFRHIDKATDVLSFPQLTFTDGEVAQVNENNEVILGDIIISIDRAKEQAEAYGHCLKREIAFLTVHSMLHLLGYDHMSPEEETDMFCRQDKILNLAGFPRE